MSRRPGVGSVRRANFRGLTSVKPIGLFLGQGGTFTRGSVAMYQTGAPTDGSTPFYAQAAANIRRIENRGDGLGPMLLMEGSVTNRFANNRTKVSLTGTDTLTDAAGPGIDGTTTAVRHQAASGQNDGQNHTTEGGTFSVYGRAFSGTSSWGYTLNGSVSGGVASQSTTYARKDLFIASTAGVVCPVDGFDRSGSGGIVAGARDILTDFPQWETTFWPTSPIVVVGSTATRAADVLSYPVGQYPDLFRTIGFRIQFAPDFTHAELVASGDICTLVSFSGGAGTDRLSLSHAAGVASVYTQDSTVGAQSTGAKTWARGSLLTIDVYPSAGRVITSGFLTGNGTTAITPFSWPVGTLWIGTNKGNAAQAAYGRFSTRLGF